MSFLSGLNSFAGGLAQGIEAGQRQKLATQENQRRQKQADREDEEYKRGADIRAAIAALPNGPQVNSAMLSGPGFDSADAAKTAVTAPTMAQSDVASTKAAGTGLPTPVPAAAPQAATLATPPDPKQAMSFVQYQDPHTGRYYNVDASQVRQPTDTDKAQQIAAVYMKYGEPEKAQQYLNSYFQGKAAQITVGREELGDSLMRSIADPASFAKTVNEGMLKPYNMPFSVQAVPFKNPQTGQTYAALEVNRNGTATPGFFLDSHGNLTKTPMPDDYSHAAAFLVSAAKGDGGVQLMAQMTGMDAQVQNMVIQRAQEKREEGKYPGEIAQQGATLANTRANTAATYQGIRASKQGMRAQAADTITNTGMDPTDYSQVPFSQVRTRLIQSEGGANGYDALAYDTPSGNAAGVRAPRPLSQMTLGQVQDFQNGAMRAKTKNYRGQGDPGSTGAGAYQFEATTLAAIAPKVLGAKWRDQPFNQANQDKLGEYLYNQVRTNPISLNSTWRGFGTGSMVGGLPPDTPRERKAAAVEGAKNSRERLEALRSKAIDIVAQNLDPSDPNFEGQVRGTLMQLVNNEPDDIKQAFRQAYMSQGVPYKQRNK